VRPRRRGVFNPKRVLGFLSPAECESLAESVGYGGNPEHKSNPGNFGLTPPAAPRPDKTLCDSAGIVDRSEALRLLQAGARGGLVSKQVKNDYPQNIWSVTQDGLPLEAQLENSGQGTYHGYPMPEGDPMRELILEAWRERGGNG
jgi:hypothetical protein